MKNNERAERWLKRAAEIRAEALALTSHDARNHLLKLADDWEHMGRQAKARAGTEASQPSRPLRKPPPTQH